MIRDFGIKLIDTDGPITFRHLGTKLARAHGFQRTGSAIRKQVWASERTKAGLAAARARGKRGGRPAKLKPKDIRIIKQIMKDKTVTATDIALRFGVSRATIQRGLKLHRESAEAKELDKLLKAQKRAAKAGQ